jgi:hypothetical protein
MRMARARSSARASGPAQVHEALHTGAAISAWRISWKAPMPSWPWGAWPDSSTTGASAMAAV